MKATEGIKNVFENYDTNVLNVSGLGLDDGYIEITHVVLDGNGELLLYNANPELGSDFQDDYYDQLLIEDDDDKWMEIKKTLLNL